MHQLQESAAPQVTEMVWEDEVLAAGQPSTAAAVPGGDDAAPMETGAGAAGGAAVPAAEGEEPAKTRSGSPAKAASSAKGSGLSGPAAAQKVSGIDRDVAATKQAGHAVPEFGYIWSLALPWRDPEICRDVGAWGPQRPRS